MNFLRRLGADFNPQVIVVSLMTLVIMMGSSVISPVLPLIAQEFGVSYAGAGALVSAFALGRIPFDFIGGALVDRFNPRWIAAGGAAVVAISAGLSAGAYDFHVLLCYRFIGGVGSALFTITAMACLARTVAPQRMGQAMGFYQSMLLIGVSVGPSVGGVAASVSQNLRAPFWAMAGLSFAVALMSLRWVGEFTPTSSQTRATTTSAGTPSALRQLSRDFTFVFICGVTLLLFGIRSGVTLNLMPLFAQETLGLSETGIGLAQSLCSLANFCVLWHAGRVLDRAGRRWVLLASLWASALAVFCFPWATTAWMLMLVAMLFGAAIGYVGPAPAAVIADLTPPGAAGKVMGIYRGAGDTGLLLGPIVVGWMASHLGFTPAFLMVALGTALVALLGSGMRETLGEVKRQP
ncbi:MAG: MFS transporter [Deltaproteobacteria bacterium]|nr:MFS transporter [Deltaproteobacteria bacterium]